VGLDQFREETQRWVDDMISGRRKRRTACAISAAVGFVAGVVATALAGGWFWYSGGREL
jgi:hypothetical protein